MRRLASIDISGRDSTFGEETSICASTPGVEFSHTHIAFSHARGCSMCSHGRTGVQLELTAGGSSTVANSRAVFSLGLFGVSSRPRCFQYRSARCSFPGRGVM